MQEVKTFAKRLKEAREHQGLKQHELANIIDVTPATISAYERANGEKGKNPTLDKAISLANALGVSLDWLCGIECTNSEIALTNAAWLSYLVGLLSHSPTTQVIEDYAPIAIDANAIRLVVSESETDAVATISFYGVEMKTFWNGLVSVMKLQKDLEPDLYNTLISALVDKYSILFTPGRKLSLREENNDLPF